MKEILTYGSNELPRDYINEDGDIQPVDTSGKEEISGAYYDALADEDAEKYALLHEINSRSKLGLVAIDQSEGIDAVDLAEYREAVALIRDTEASSNSLRGMRAQRRRPGSRFNRRYGARRAEEVLRGAEKNHREMVVQRNLAELVLTQEDPDAEPGVSLLRVTFRQEIRDEYNRTRRINKKKKSDA